MKDIRDHSLLAHNTFGIDARCRRYLEYASVDEAQTICRQFSATDYPLLIIGEGSNLLLTADYPATVITPEARFDVQVVAEAPDGETVDIECWAGTTFDDVVAYAVDHGWHGAENLSLTPGEVGASAIQNVGAYGMEAKDVIHTVEALEIATGNAATFTCADCCYAYRYSKFKAEWKGKYIVTHVTYRLSKTFTPRLDYGNLRAVLERKGITVPTAQDVRQAVIEIRQSKLPDPKDEGNAGSFFMNPIVSKEKFDELYARYPNMPYYVVGEKYKIPAGWMIEQCGWKGKTLGRAGVHSRQALVLVNKGGATGAEILALCNAVRADVQRTFGIDIHPEVNII